jgi:hypothetical protein
VLTCGFAGHAQASGHQLVPVRGGPWATSAVPTSLLTSRNTKSAGHSEAVDVRSGRFSASRGRCALHIRSRCASQNPTFYSHRPAGMSDRTSSATTWESLSSCWDRPSSANAIAPRQRSTHREHGTRRFHDYLGSVSKKRCSAAAPRVGSCVIHQWPRPSRTSIRAPARCAARRCMVSVPT